MNIALANTGRAALEAELKDIGATLAALKHALNRLESNTITFVAKDLDKDVSQIGDALNWFGVIHAGMGQAFRGLQGLHAAAHEAEKRLLAPSEEQSGPGDKTPPPKP